MNHSNGRSRRRVGICREGWYFIFILAFVILGAILRQINLLVILASMMVAPLLFNWRIAVAMIRHLRIKRNLPEYVHAGQTFVVEHAVENQSTWLSSWDVKVTDRIRQQGEPPTTKSRSKQNETRIDTIAAQINPNDTTHVSYRCHLSRRGEYHFGPITVSSRFPMGLVSSSFNLPTQQTMLVAPAIGKLTPSWHRRIRSIAAGSTSTERRRGMENDEFYGLRSWNNGDSQRWIHWRSTARRGKLTVKQFDQPSDRDFAIALDLWSSGTPSEDDAKRVEMAVSFVATALRQLNPKIHGRVAVALCGDTSLVVTDQSQSEFAKQVMKRLATIQAANETEISDRLVELSHLVSPGTPLIVVSTRHREAHQLKTVEADQTTADTLLHHCQWLPVDSTEFRQMFQPIDPAENEQFRSLTRQVASNAKPNQRQKVTSE